jgi:hypothetical protein
MRSLFRTTASKVAIFLIAFLVLLVPIVSDATVNTPGELQTAAMVVTTTTDPKPAQIKLWVDKVNLNTWNQQVWNNQIWKNQVLKDKWIKTTNARLAAEKAARAAAAAEAAKRAAAQAAPKPTVSRAAPSGGGSGRCGGNLPPCCVMYRESGGSLTAQNPTSTASGKWQFLDSTWAGYGGYASAYLAPESVQDAKAAALWAGGAGASHWGGGC